MLRTITRRRTIQVPVGGLVIGSEQPVRVQSMTNTDSRDAQATIAQIRRLQEVGCELVRVTIPDEESAANIPAFLAAMDVPFIADIHFNHRMALAAIEAGAHKVRINPGNIGSERKVAEVSSLTSSSTASAASGPCVRAVTRARRAAGSGAPGRDSTTFPASSTA